MEHIQLEQEHLQTAAEKYAMPPTIQDGDQVPVVPADMVRYGNKLADAMTNYARPLWRRTSKTPNHFGKKG